MNYYWEKDYWNVFLIINYRLLCQFFVHRYLYEKGFFSSIKSWSATKRYESAEEKHRVKLIQKNPKIEKTLINAIKHSASSEFHILPARGKEMLTLLSLKHLGVVTEISCHLSEKQFGLRREYRSKTNPAS